jgi:ABC-type oligopeptide transport system ATPase subunit
MPAGAVTALGDVSIRVDAADYVAITGPSGCGKSTLLHILGCVDQASAGSLVFEGRDVGALTESERSRIRLTRIGFVFQRFFLLPMSRGRWRTGRRCCSPTNRLVSSTKTPAPRSQRCSIASTATARPSSSSLTIQRWPRAPDDTW